MSDVSLRYASLSDAARRATLLLRTSVEIKMRFSVAGIRSALISSTCRNTDRADGASARKDRVCIRPCSFCHRLLLWLSPSASVSCADR
jgi:hypothetical protein